jgi:hypothetical protein
MRRGPDARFGKQRERPSGREIVLTCAPQSFCPRALKVVDPSAKSIADICDS